jgi:hypothetical protein
MSMNESNPAPVAVLAFLMMIPAFLVELVRSAARGFRGLPILTHLGVRGGTIARVYASLYVILLVGFAFYAPQFLRTFSPILQRDIVASALSPFHMPLAGSLIFIIPGIALIPFTAWAIRKRERLEPSLAANPTRRRWFRVYMYSHCALFLEVGLLSLISAPSAIPLGLLVASTYLVVIVEPLALYDDDAFRPA